MKRCSNSHKGCPELARGGAVHYCTDCYHAWQEGGYGAVQASIDAKRKPSLDKHECVGTAQLAALQAEVAEYAAFKASVVALYTTNFMGKITQPDPTSLLPRIEMDRMIAQAARTAMHRDGKAPDKGAPLNLRSHLTVEWLKGLRLRLAFRCAAERVRADRTRDLECQPSPRMHRAVNTTPHPSAETKPEMPITGRQLDRIESLAKQAATVSVFWPCFITFAATATFALVAHATW